jgi:hypothetical protein
MAEPLILWDRDWFEASFLPSATKNVAKAVTDDGRLWEESGLGLSMSLGEGQPKS